MLNFYGNTCILYIGSGTYSDAVQDLKTYFTDGLCCKETEVSQHEMVRVSGLMKIEKKNNNKKTATLCNDFVQSNTTELSPFYVKRSNFECLNIWKRKCCCVGQIFSNH